jgi:hypothetical protein
MIKRAHKLTVMLSKEEDKLLKELADTAGLSAADVVRQAIRNAALNHEKVTHDRRN